jgi:hypothetical protein
MPITTAQEATMRAPTQLDSRLVFATPIVRERPLQLEPVELDTFGGLVASARRSTIYSRGALS